MSPRPLAQLYAELTTTHDTASRDKLLDAILDHPDYAQESTP